APRGREGTAAARRTRPVSLRGHRVRRLLVRRARRRRIRGGGDDRRPRSARAGLGRGPPSLPRRRPHLARAPAARGRRRALLRARAAMSTGRPVWDDDASAEAFWDALPARVDVAVVGAGLAGLSAAYHAKQLTPDRQVAVLEAGRIGAGASGRSTGMVGPGVAQRLSALAQRAGDYAARAFYGASLQAVQATR